MIQAQYSKLNTQNSKLPLRVAYFGMRCAFSCPPLRALLDAGVDVCAVIVPAARARGKPIQHLVTPTAPSRLPVINLSVSGDSAGEDIVQIAAERGVPLFEVSRIGSAAVRAAIGELRPDLGCVACFPRRIPANMLELPSLGFVNMHPSLLPAHRGPEPLFWTLRNGEAITGVTIHRMDEALDTGDIVVQEAIALPDGITEAEAEQRCATLGAQLLVEAADALHRNTLLARPQPPGGSYESYPEAGDFTISTTWSARRAFNFMRGTAARGMPYPLEVAGERFVLVNALSFDADEHLDAPYICSGSQLHVQCAPGVLHARGRRMKSMIRRD